MKLPLLLLALLCGWEVLAWNSVYPTLPEVIATNFDGSGAANGWSSRESFGLLRLAFPAVTVGTLLASVLVLGRMPASLINIPRRDYWLAPERRKQTITYVRVQLLWAAVATMALIRWVNHLVVEANQRTPPELDSSFLWGFFSFMTLMLVWVVRFVRRFWRVPDPFEAT